MSCRFRGLRADGNSRKPECDGKFDTASGKTPYGIDSMKKRTSLLGAQWRHGNWNIERGAGDAHAASLNRFNGGDIAALPARVSTRILMRLGFASDGSEERLRSA